MKISPSIDAAAKQDMMKTAAMLNSSVESEEKPAKDEPEENPKIEVEEEHEEIKEPEVVVTQPPEEEPEKPNPMADQVN